MSALVQDFLVAADRNDLDWRLLPSIALVESGAGKSYKNNNVFGWDSCDTAFPSVRAGIHHVANRLANSPFYREKDTLSKLRVYNSNPEYPLLVKSVMRELGPAEFE